MEAVLLQEDRDRVRLLTMNRPDKLNALNHALSQALLDALRAADQDEGVGCVVLAGAGRAFCAGADTSEFKDLTPGNPQLVEARAELTMNLHLAFSRMAKPVVSAVQGYAMGGGAGLALACDLAVAAESARFGYPEVKHGIVAAIVMPNLIRQVGRKAAFELIATGAPVDARRALALGMVNRVVGDDALLAEAMTLAAGVAALSGPALAAAKRLFHEVADLPLAEGLAAGREANRRMRALRKP